MISERGEKKQRDDRGIDRALGWASWRSISLIALLTHVICFDSGCVAFSLGQHYGDKASGAQSVLIKGGSRSEVNRVLDKPRATNLDNGKTVVTFLTPNATWANWAAPAREALQKSRFDDFLKRK